MAKDQGLNREVRTCEQTTAREEDCQPVKIRGIKINSPALQLKCKSEKTKRA